MGKRGGRRKGAGRKKGGKNRSTILKDDIKSHAIEMIKCHVEDLIDAKLELALGDYYIENIDQVGAVKVYKAKPSGNDINDLLAYAIGKPAQKIDINAKIEAIQEVGDNMRAILKGGYGSNRDTEASPQLVQR